MSDLNCNSCNELRENAADFVASGVTDTICTSLKNDTGFNPNLTNLHTNCEDLHNANDCLVGMMRDEVEAYEVCDWKEYMKKFVGNIYEVLKAMICSMCGIWTNIHNLWSKFWQLINAMTGDNQTVPVFRTYEFTVAADSFDLLETFDGLGIYFSPNQAAGGEYWIKIPVADMDEVLGVWTQPRVVGLRLCPVTVAVQQQYKEGDYYVVNFDVYEMVWQEHGTFALPIEFLVVGTRKLT